MTSESLSAARSPQPRQHAALPERRRPTEPLDLLCDRAGAVAQPPSQIQAVFLRQIVLALSPKLRDVFVLNHIRGFTYREIASLLGISVKTVEKRMSQALAQCAAAMRD
jgi:RNA polymerase sigma factor (sigma-70 family)